MTPKKDLELYLHIPFCRQKCRYCDFLSAPLAADSSTADGYVPEAYVDALLSQIVQESQFIKSAESLRFSGAAVRRPFCASGIWNG